MSQKTEGIVLNATRLDVYVRELMNSSRNQIVALIKNGHIEVNSKTITKSGLKLKKNDLVTVHLPERKKKNPKYYVNFSVDVLYEDNDLMVINKPAGIVVHPAPSLKEATLVDWLKLRGVSLSTLSGEERHGIVHRLDRGTSGALVIAKNNVAHQKLSEQLQNKSMGRYYIAAIDLPLKDECTVEKPIGRSPTNRLKMAVVDGGREAKTAFVKLALSSDGGKEIIAAKLYSGRTHQIRVHLGSMQRHIVGDTLYGFKAKKDTMERLLLHAFLIYFIHPSSGEIVHVKAPIHSDMMSYFQNHFNMEKLNVTLSSDTLPDYFSTSV